MRLVYWLLFGFIATSVLLPLQAAAQSYQVNAIVHFPAPTQAATITTPLDASTISNATLAVSGDCEILQPSTVIVVMRNNVNAGSTSCTNGSFNLNIQLQTGANQLIVRSASVSGLYGPDSPAVTVTLELPPAPPTTNTPAASTNQAPLTNDSDESASIEPAVVASPTEAANNAALTNLSAEPLEPFTIMTDEHLVSIRVRVGGGQAPYVITIDWGDKTVQAMNVPGPGVYELTHNYKRTGSYPVKGRVRDVLGATTSFEYRVVNPKATKRALASPAGSFEPQASIDYYVPLGLAAALFSIIGGYGLHLRHLQKIGHKKR